MARKSSDVPRLKLVEGVRSIDAKLSGNTSNILCDDIANPLIGFGLAIILGATVWSVIVYTILYFY